MPARLALHKTTWAAVALALAATCGCGQTGALYLPPTEAQTGQQPDANADAATEAEREAMKSQSRQQP